MVSVSKNFLKCKRLNEGKFKDYCIADSNITQAISSVGENVEERKSCVLSVGT